MSRPSLCLKLVRFRTGGICKRKPVLESMGLEVNNNSRIIFYMIFICAIFLHYRTLYFVNMYCGRNVQNLYLIGLMMILFGKRESLFHVRICVCDFSASLLPYYYLSQFYLFWALLPFARLFICHWVCFMQYHTVLHFAESAIILFVIFLLINK